MIDLVVNNGRSSSTDVVS